MCEVGSGKGRPRSSCGIGESRTSRAFVGATASSSAFKPATNRGRPGLAVERVGHAVADDQHGRLRGHDLLHRAPETGLGRIEPGPGEPADRVAAPAQVAEGQVQVGVREGQERLEVAVSLVALDERIADQDDPVAVLKRPGPGLLGGRAVAANEPGARRIARPARPVRTIRKRAGCKINLRRG